MGDGFIQVMAWLAPFMGWLAFVVRALLEIGLLAVMIYSVLYFLRGTRAAPVLVGITVVIFLMWLVSQSLSLDVIEWLLMKIWALLAVSLLVIFQPEIRRALAETGSQLISLKNNRGRELSDTVDMCWIPPFTFPTTVWGP